jgi:hypothetical protein
MTKATVTRTWIVGLIVLVAGLLVGGISLGLMLAYGGTYVSSPSGTGSDFVPTLNGVFWTTLGFMILGFTAAAIGGVIQLVAWIGALMNTYQIEDKTWFVILLVGGLLGLIFGLIGFAAMVAYLIAGPDGTAIAHHQVPRPAQPAVQQPYAQQPYAPYAQQPYAAQPPAEKPFVQQPRVEEPPVEQPPTYTPTPTPTS